MNYIPLNTIYSYFETGKYPTQPQFQASWSSFWHKGEQIPLSIIDGIDVFMQSTASAEQFKAHLQDENAHITSLAKLDASNLNDLNTEAWRQVLGVKDIPENILLADLDGYVKDSQLKKASATESGIVDNETLQELGGTDKKINGVRIGNGGISTNTVFGKNTLNKSVGKFQTAIGIGSLFNHQQGDNNTSGGAYSQYYNQRGTYNTSWGTSTLFNLVEGTGNVASGDSSLYSLKNGDYNVGFGTKTLYLLTEGNNNVAFGGSALTNLKTGSNNIALGVNALSNLNGNESNNIGIKNAGVAGQSNKFWLGPGVGENAFLYGDYTSKIFRVNASFSVKGAVQTCIDDKGVYSSEYIEPTSELHFTQRKFVDTKVSKTTTTILAPDSEFKYAYIFDEENNAKRMLAGDLGKNIANSYLTSVANAGLKLGANWAIDTQGFYYFIKGLYDSSNDPTFNLLLSQNADGRISKSNGKELFKKFPSLLSKAEKEQFAIDWNNQYSNGALNVYSVTPTIIKSENIVKYFVFSGLNLNVNPANTSVRFIPVGSPIGSDEIDCLGFQTSADGKSMTVTIYGDSLSIDTQYNIIIRTTSPTIQTHRTVNAVKVVNDVQNIDINNITWEKIAYKAGEEDTIFTTNGGLFSYNSNTANKAYAYEPNQFVGAIKSSTVFPSDTDFHLELNLSLSFSGTNAISDTNDFYGYLGLLQSTLPISLADNSFIRVINSTFRSGGYNATYIWNNINTTNTRIAGSFTLNANVVIERQGNVYTQFLTVGGITIEQTISGNTNAVSLSLAVTNGSTQKSINGSIVQAFTF